MFGHDQVPTLTVDGMLGSRHDIMLSIDVSFLIAVPEYESITLRLFPLEANGDYCGTFQITNNRWDESITWMNAPDPNGSALGNAQGVTVGEWFQLDVTQILTLMKADNAAPTILSLMVAANGGGKCVFSSLSGEIGHAPNTLVMLNTEEADGVQANSTAT
jgi:hypothetical protein